MRILFLLTQDLESPAGVGRYFPLAKNLARLGHQVSIAALHSNFLSLKDREFTKEGVQVHYVAQMHVLKQANQKIYYSTGKLLLLVAQATLALSKAALSIPADIIHIGKPHPMNSIAGLLARILKGRCLFLDSDDYEAATGHFSSRWQKQAVAFFEDKMPRWVQHVTTHTSFLRDRLLGLGVSEAHLTYLPNGVDIERFSSVNPEKVAALRQELNLNSRKVIAFIGSLSAPSHPVELLLATFSLVHQAIPESVLLIVGAGDQYLSLQSKTVELGLSDVTRFTGFIHPVQAPLYYRLADCLVDPVFDDLIGRSRLPLKLFESWISETPFITGDVGDRSMVLGSPPAGILVKAGDAQSLAQGIFKVLQNPEIARTLRQRGMQRAQDYTWMRLAGKLAEVYSRLLKNQRM